MFRFLDVVERSAFALFSTVGNLVEGHASRRGGMAPLNQLAIIKPVKVCGATLRRVTGYNAWFIQENKIGPGAKIDLVRSIPRSVQHLIKVHLFMDFLIEVHDLFLLAQ